MLIRFSLIFLIALTSSVSFTQCKIIPYPWKCELSAEKLMISSFKIDTTNLNPTNFIFLKDELKARFNAHLEISSKDAMIQFEIGKAINTGYYRIDIGDKVLLSSMTAKGQFYAINSFLQLLEQSNERLYLFKGLIEDYPKFEWRGLHLDVSRHFFTVDEVKRFIDLMAYYKFNTFHWHLTDDQGWRIEIKKYPKLTEIGAWRDSTVNHHYSTKPRTYTVEKYGGFYTQAQIKEVVEYASKKYITVVPEIELPGHSRAALAAYPEFSCTGQQQNVPGLWGIFDDIYCSKPETIAFLKDVLSEVVELFPSEYIHIGGDEAPKTRWKTCQKCQKNIKEHNLKDEHELQSYVIRQMDEFLTSKGRKLIGWDEILEGGLSPNASVMSWRGFEGGVEAVKQKHAVVMTPGSHCYFDHYQSENPNEPLAIGGYTPLEKVYDFNPIPSGLTAEQEKFILGGQANVWTEYIPDFKQAEYMVFPRALALSQALWTVEKPSYAVFQSSLTSHHFPFLEQKKVNYSKAIFYPKLVIDVVKTGFYVMVQQSGEIVKSFDFNRKDYPKATGWSEEIAGNRFNLTLHAGIGSELSFQTLPNKKYSSNYQSALVDGVLGRRPWNGKEWLGFDTTSISFTVRLDQPTDLFALTLSLLEDNGSWIYLPQSILFSVSLDGKKWKKFEVTSIHELNRITLHEKVQFIKVDLTTMEKIPEGKDGAGFKPWTFMDELIIERD